MNGNRERSGGVAEARPIAEAAPRAPARPDACIILAGGLRPSPLEFAAGRSVLDLPLSPADTPLTLWMRSIAEVTRAAGEATPVRVVHGGAGGLGGGGDRAPQRAPEPPGVRLSIEREPRQYRGPAGLAQDVCREYHPDALLLIVEGGRRLSCGLGPLLSAHAVADADITVACNADDSPAGVYLARRSTLDLVPGAGFMDLKEQWLSKAVRDGRHIIVHRLEGQGAMPLRTRPQFLRAALESCAAGPDAARHNGRVGTDWAVVAPGASVGEKALIAGSVVCGGATVGENCVIVRSIVCPGATAAPGAEIVDSVVAPGGVRSDEWAELLGRRRPGR